MPIQRQPITNPNPMHGPIQSQSQSNPNQGTMHNAQGTRHMVHAHARGTLLPVTSDQ